MFLQKIKKAIKNLEFRFLKLEELLGIEYLDFSAKYGAREGRIYELEVECNKLVKEMAILNRDNNELAEKLAALETYLNVAPKIVSAIPEKLVYEVEIENVKANM